MFCIGSYGSQQLMAIPARWVQVPKMLRKLQGY